MPIERIDLNLCTYCGECDVACPMDVIRVDRDKKTAEIVYPKDCQQCLLCEVYCPEDAIYVNPKRARPVPFPY